MDSEITKNLKLIISTRSNTCYYGGLLLFLDWEAQTWDEFWINGPVLREYPRSPLDRGITYVNGLTGMCRKDRMLYVARWSDILVYEMGNTFPPQLKLQQIIEHPMLNDLHDIRIYNDKLFVSSSGTERVICFTLDGNFLKEWVFAQPEEFTPEPLDTSIRLDKVTSTQWHPLHVNASAIKNEKIYASIQKLGEVRSMDKSGKIETVVTGLSRPHDGHFINDREYVTTNATTFEIRCYEISDRGRFSLKYSMRVPGSGRAKDADTGKYKEVGWLRGLLHLGGYRFIVGQSAWKHWNRRDQSAILYEIDLAAEKILKQIKIPRYPFPPSEKKLSSLRSLAPLFAAMKTSFYPNINIYQILNY